MKIGIDARMMTPGATRGIGRYIEELVRAMLQAAPEHEYILVTRNAIHPFCSHPSVKTVVADVPWYGLMEQIRMPWIFRSLGADFIHIPHWNVPLFFWGAPLVITIHDLLLRHEPLSARISTRHPVVAAIKRFGYLFTLHRAVQRAQKILVPTQVVAQDVARFYPTVSTKVAITGEGMTHGVSQIADAPLPFFPQPPLDYLFYVGSAYPHKGLEFLLEAWPDIELRFPHLSLKIAGAEDIFMKRLKHHVHTHQLKRIEFLGHVSEEQLRRLYQDALAFVFPSRLEGFGFPPLEALAAGCPVICSDIPVLKEVLGEEGIFFFRSGSRAAILDAIQRVMSDPVRARASIPTILPNLRARHDWRSTARLTLSAYSSLFANVQTVHRLSA